MHKKCGNHRASKIQMWIVAMDCNAVWRVHCVQIAHVICMKQPNFGPFIGLPTVQPDYKPGLHGQEADQQAGVHGQKLGLHVYWTA